MSLQIEIRLDTGEHGGRYVASVAGTPGEGELAWRNAAPGVVVAYHTEVPASLQGRGIAAKLVERLVADARAQGFKIIPTCSYIVAQRKRHPEWEDVFAN